MFVDYEIKDANDAIKLNAIAIKQSFPIYAEYKNMRFDARSLLALFTMIGKRILVIAPDHADSVKFSKVADQLRH